MPIIDLDLDGPLPEDKQPPKPKTKEPSRDQAWEDYMKPGGGHDQWLASGMPF